MYKCICASKHLFSHELVLNSTQLNWAWKIFPGVGELFIRRLRFGLKEGGGDYSFGQKKVFFRLLLLLGFFNLNSPSAHHVGSRQGDSQAKIIFLPAFFLFVILEKVLYSFSTEGSLQDHICPTLPSLLCTMHCET